MKPLIHALLVGEYSLFNESVAMLMRRQPDMALVESASDGREAVEKIQSLAINTVLLNSEMSRSDSLQLARELKMSFPQLKIILIGMEPNEAYILKFIEAGVSGYILKESTFAELLSVIQAVHEGQPPCSPRIAALVFARVSKLSRYGKLQSMLGPGGLTPREKDILELIASGLGNKEIARQLDISIFTVKNHVHNILEKLQVHYRREAILCAYEKGWLKHPFYHRASAGKP